MPPKKTNSPAKAVSPKKRGRPSASPAAPAPRRQSPRKAAPSTRKASATPSPAKVTKKTASPTKSTRKSSTASPAKKTKYAKKDDETFGDDESSGEERLGSKDKQSVTPVRPRSKSPAKKQAAKKPDHKALEATLREMNSSEQDDQPTPPSPIKALARSPKQPASAKSKPSKVPAKTKKPSEGRGTVESWANPGKIRNAENDSTTEKDNPFYELMPAKEVWHRRMPSFFPFGETPFMEAVMSRQINEDLNRKHPEPVSAEKASFLGVQVPNFVSKALKGNQPPTKPDGPPKRASIRIPTTWDLPAVTESNVHREFQRLTSSKRKGAARTVESPKKRQRRAAS